MARSKQADRPSMPTVPFSAEDLRLHENALAVAAMGLDSALGRLGRALPELILGKSNSEALAEVARAAHEVRTAHAATAWFVRVIAEELEPHRAALRACLDWTPGAAK